MFPLQGGKISSIKQKISLENKDKLDKTYENFKRLGLAYEQYVNKAVSQIKDIEDLSYLKVSSVGNLTDIFVNWDKFEEAMPVSIKELFRKTSVNIKIDSEVVNMTYEKFKELTRDIPLKYEAPVETLDKILHNSNIKIDKVSTRIRKTKGTDVQDTIRANSVSEIVKDIVNESSQQKLHQEYFQKLIKEDAEQFYAIKAKAETNTDVTERKNIIECYNYIVSYKRACIEGIRKTLDTYESQLKSFLIQLAQKSRDEQQYKNISTMMQSFVNYKNDPNAFFQILANMKDNNQLKNQINSKIQNDNVPAEVENNNKRVLNLALKTKADIQNIFKHMTQGIVAYINLDQGLLVKFGQAMSENKLPGDFTQIVLNVFVNFVMLCLIQPNTINEDSKEICIDYNMLNTDYNVFSRQSHIGEVSRVKNWLSNPQAQDEQYIQNIQNILVTWRENAQIQNLMNGININGLQQNANQRQQLLSKLPDIERLLHNTVTKNRTQYILYRMIDNMIKSIYGTIVLIIQAHSKEQQNIYTLLGSSRRNLQGGVVGTPCKEACFSTYILMYRLHNLFVFQASRIFFHGNHYYDENRGADGNIPFERIGDLDYNQIYSIIQITRTSKFYDLYKCLTKSSNTAINDFDEYFRCINTLWEQIPGQTTGILSERAHNLLSQYVQELINNMIITIQTLEAPNRTLSVGVDTFNHIESKKIDGINTFGQEGNTEDYETKIIVEERNKLKQDDVLELYMTITNQIEKFTEVYVEQHKDENFQLGLYKNAVLDELQRYKNIWLAKTENQSDLQAVGVNNNLFKKGYLVDLITSNELFSEIKTGFNQFSEKFGLQYKQLKFIQIRIMDLLYSYHKHYVETYNNLAYADNGDLLTNPENNNIQFFNKDFIQAVKYLRQQTSGLEYKIFLRYNLIRMDQRITERELTYKANQLVQNADFVKMKIYMFFLDQLERRVNQNVPDNTNLDDLRKSYADINGNNVIGNRTISVICQILVSMGIIEKYNEKNPSSYFKEQLPFLIHKAGAGNNVPTATLASNDNQLYMILTRKFYALFQNQNTYLRNFCVSNLRTYQESLEMLKCIPLLEIKDGQIDASALYAFLNQAKDSVLQIYDKTNSIYTRQEMKEVIRHQLDLSLDIVPVLKDAFDKYVLPVQNYYNQYKWDMDHLDHGWFSAENYKQHVYKLINFKEQPYGQVKSLINKVSTNTEGDEQVDTTYKNCRVLAGQIQHIQLRGQGAENRVSDYDIDVVKTLNEKISEIHDLLFQTFHTIPKEFREQILSNDYVRQYSELTDIQSGETTFQLPLTTIQMPFHTNITNLDLSIKDQQTVIDNMLNMNEVDRYIYDKNNITYLTSSMKQFMERTYTTQGSNYNRIPLRVKHQYINLFRKLFSAEQIQDADLPDQFVWQKLFIRLFDKETMLNENNALAVDAGDDIGGQENIGDMLADLYGQPDVAYDNQLQSVGNNAFQNAVRKLVRVVIKKFHQIKNENNAERQQRIVHLIRRYFTEFNLVNLMIGMIFYKSSIANQIKEGFEVMYVPENGNWDNLRTVKAYAHQQVSYTAYNNADAVYQIVSDFVSHQHQQRQERNEQRNLEEIQEAEVYDIKRKTYASNIQYMVNKLQPVIDGIPTNKLTRLTLPHRADPNTFYFIPYVNQNMFRIFLIDYLKTFSQEFDGLANMEQLPQRQRHFQNIQNQLRNLYKQLANQNNPVIVPIIIPSESQIKNGTILQTAYAKGFTDSVSKIINQYQQTRDIAVIYDHKSQKIEIYNNQNYRIEGAELPYLYMNNVLALSDDQQENEKISEDLKINFTYDLKQKINELKTKLTGIEALNTPAVNIYRSYISASQTMVDKYLNVIDWNKYIDTKFKTKYFNLQHFLNLDKTLRQRRTLFDNNRLLDGQEGALNMDDLNGFNGELVLYKFLSLIFEKGINHLKSYDKTQLAGQVYKNFNFYTNMIASGRYNALVNHYIRNTEYMRLTFVKRLTGNKPIIGEDHYWITQNIKILKDQTRFQIVENGNENYLPDWWTVREGQQNQRNKLISYLIDYNSNYMNIYQNQLYVFDIRKIPYMQHYTQQPYVYSVVKINPPAANNGIIRDDRRIVKQGFNLQRELNQIQQDGAQLNNVRRQLQDALANHQPQFVNQEEVINIEIEQVDHAQQALDRVNNQIEQLRQLVQERRQAVGAINIQNLQRDFDQRQNVVQGMNVENLQRDFDQRQNAVQGMNVENLQEEYDRRRAAVQGIDVQNLQQLQRIVNGLNGQIQRLEQRLNDVRNNAGNNALQDQRQQQEQQIQQAQQAQQIQQAQQAQQIQQAQQAQQIQQVQQAQQIQQPQQAQEALIQELDENAVQIQQIQEEVAGVVAEVVAEVEALRENVPLSDDEDSNLDERIHHPVVDQPVVEQPVVDQPVVDQPVVEQPVVEQPEQIQQDVQNNEYIREPRSTREILQNIGVIQMMMGNNGQIIFDRVQIQPMLGQLLLQTREIVVNNLQQTLKHNDIMHMLPNNVQAIITDTEQIINNIWQQIIAQDDINLEILQQQIGILNALVNETTNHARNMIQERDDNGNPYYDENERNQIQQLIGQGRKRHLQGGLATLQPDIENNEIYFVIPQHLMNEISMTTGLTNTSTTNVAVQLTFDISDVYGNVLDRDLGRLQNEEQRDKPSYLVHFVEQFYKLRRLTNGRPQNGTIVQFMEQFLTDPVIFTYNVATQQNKDLRKLLNEFTQSNINNMMKLFSILKLQPFHPIQLIKDNSIYQIMSVFGIYVNKYNSLFASQNVLIANQDKGTFKQLNYTTKYGQRIYIQYHTNTNPQVNTDTTIQYNRKPSILYEQGQYVVYYSQENGQDKLIQVQYNGNNRIETYQQLQALLNKHDMAKYGIDIQSFKETTIDQNVIFNGNVIQHNDDMDDMNVGDTVIRQFNDEDHTIYQLVKYNGIILSNNINNIQNPLNHYQRDGQINNVQGLVIQIFDFIKHYTKLIQTNNATDKQGITYSQYHVTVSDENM